MNKLIRTLSPLSAIVAAAVLTACGPSTGSADNSALAEVAQAAARGEDRVSPKELAEWLIEERRDFVLIDVRSSEDFERGSIADATISQTRRPTQHARRRVGPFKIYPHIDVDRPGSGRRAA